jgi:hypothetical protein
MRDIAYLASLFGSSGDPGTKAMRAYDSGWINVTGIHGQNITVSHGLGVDDWNNESIVVEITGKESETGGLLRYLGLTSREMSWNATYGGGGAYSMIETFDGGHALLGTDFSSGETDFWLVKTDSLGNMQWKRTYGGYYPDDPSCVVQTHDNGYALVGCTYNTDELDSDFWLVKTNSSGHLQWSRTYGGENEEDALSVVTTSDGGFAIAGSTTSFGAGGSDLWLVKTNSSGHMQWNRTYGGSDVDGASCVVRTSDGGYAIAGMTESYGSGWSDYWLVKTDEEGKMQWNKTYGGASYDMAYSVIETLDGGYALSGHTGSFGAGNSDFWLVKTDSSGVMQWNQTYGGIADDYGSFVVQISNGEYVIAGSTNSFGAGSTDFWLIKTDCLGRVQWNGTYGGADSDEARCLVATLDGWYAVAGGTASYSPGMWLVKVNLNAECGLVWIDAALNRLVLYRGALDSSWNYVRVQIWERKQ